MQDSALIILYSLFFFLITMYRFHYGLFFVFLLLPTYLIRFTIGPLPTTLLEVIVLIITTVWLIKYKSHITYHISRIVKQHPTFFTASILFLIAATISVFTSIHLRAAAGEWKAFYVEPFLVFLIIATVMQSPENQKSSTVFNFKFSIFKQWNNVAMKQCGDKTIIHGILFALILSGLVTSVLAIYQHFTGWMVPYSFWENRNTYRVTAWYGFPNGVGLFLAPLVPLAMYLTKYYWKVLITKIQETDKFQPPNYKHNKLNFKTWLLFVSCILYLITAPLAIFYAKSTGGLIGIAAALGFLLVLYKKTRWPTIILGIVSIVSTVSLPSLSHVKQELLLQDRSGQLRIDMWGETLSFLSDHPIAGAGLASYSELIYPYRIDKWIEVFHHPHNIFLTMWVNLGLLGLFAFVWILISIFNLQFSIYKKNKKLPQINYFLIASLLTIIVMGLVDSPYIKNDLAIVFWTILALLIPSNLHWKNDSGSLQL